ncbi:unnamed protein product [Acanthosepion pharaonis]|uniref:Uncharacterized protein n=1 Tax=Acanthosepion pharaonis TaxID=158019 RepID=A0A812ALD1_ACAPH|nr:unnamed protein product [Sepia pharaonis]
MIVSSTPLVSPGVDYGFTYFFFSSVFFLFSFIHSFFLRSNYHSSFLVSLYNSFSFHSFFFTSFFPFRRYSPPFIFLLPFFSYLYFKFGFSFFIQPHFPFLRSLSAYIILSTSGFIFFIIFSLSLTSFSLHLFLLFFLRLFFLLPSFLIPSDTSFALLFLSIYYSFQFLFIFLLPFFPYLL